VQKFGSAKKAVDTPNNSRYNTDTQGANDMKQVYDAVRTFNQFVLAALALVTVWLIMDPELAGTWRAQRDIAYDTIWMTYVGDCDCTDSLD
jgi:hypothetical protein